MTDVKAKSPKKRKSLPNQQNQLQSVKKLKAESNTLSPKNGVAPKTPKKESPEKLKKFKGTGDLIKSEQPSPKKNEPKKKAKAQLGQPRRARLVEQIKGGNKQVEAELNKKIKLLESLPEKTKTAKRKLAFLKKVIGEVEGNLPKQPVKGEGKNKNKTISQKRRQRRKKSTTGAEDKNETAVSNEQKSVVKKENAGAIQQKKNQLKKVNSPGKKVQQLVKKEKAPKQAKGDKKPVKQEVAQVENKKNKGKKAVAKQEKVEDEPEDESVEEDDVEEEDSEEEGGDVSEEEDEDDEVSC